jgi:glycosyltransferase involved in cell wall biosynthesis
MKFFVSKGFNVKFMGDNFWHYPDTPYVSELESIGIEVLYGSWYANNWKEWFKDNSQYIDYIFLSRPHVSIKYIDWIKENTGAKILYYGHDLHFLREKREFEFTGDSKFLESSDKWREIEEKIIRRADRVYYLSTLEKELLESEMGVDNVRIMPTFVYERFLKSERDFSDRKDLMFVGGFGHTPNIDATLWFVNEIFPKIKRKLSDIKFYIIGSKVPREIKELSGENILVTGFVSDEELEEYYGRCRLAVVPLRYGAGVKGKIIEAIYNQIPVVTTSVGAEGLEEVDRILSISDEADDFAMKVVELYNDEKLWNDISDRELRYAKRYFSPERVEKVFSEDIDFTAERSSLQ